MAMNIPTAFERSLRTAGADRFRGSALLLLAGLAFLAAWAWWAVSAQVPLYEVSGKARLEIGQASYAVQSPEVGRVTFNNLVAGREVVEGEVLLELDSRTEQFELKEQKTRLRVASPELSALRSQMEAEERARVQEGASSIASIEEAQRKAREAELPARYAEDEEQRLRKLKAEGLVPEREYEKGLNDARRLRAAVETSRIVADRLKQEQSTRDRERDVRLDSLRASIARIEGTRTTNEAGLSRLGYAIERKKVRAPVSGRIAEAKIIRPGSVTAEGETLATIVPAGKLSIVAQFAPPAALGRVKQGQPARLRLEGFPWTEFGTVTGRVLRVADEVRDGTVRVELSLQPDALFKVPLTHGMPGTVEIEVERVTPATLALRLAGQAIAGPRSQGTRQ